MKMIKFKTQFLTLLLSIFAIQAFSQEIDKKQNDLCINLKFDSKDQYFVIGVDNHIDIVYAQDEEITLEDITATFEHDKTKEKRALQVFEQGDHFYINPDSLGQVTLSVKTKDGIKEKTFRTKNLTLVAKLSLYGANHPAEINKEEFRLQTGVRVEAEHYPIDIRYPKLHYDIIRICSNNEVQKMHNIGGEFEPTSKKLIVSADSGDLFIFRNIYYKFPGDVDEKRLGDMIFEIK